MPILSWLTRDEDVKATQKVPYRLLEEVPDLSYGDKDTGNMLIQGDNLEALKSLLPFYAGQVKCIFIDPPYNTRKDFEHYDDNLEHSQWLAMMWPRLELLRELLAEDGSIWVTIDDDEGHYLKVIMDEVFGRRNFVANVVWQKKYAPQNDAKWLSDSHDHILCFAKNKQIWRPRKLERSAEAVSLYKNPDNDPRGPWMSDNLSVKTYSQSTDYPITTPSGKVVNPPASRCWSVSTEKLQELIADNRVWFGAKGTAGPRLKRFLSEVQDGVVSKTIWLREDVGDNQDAKREVKAFNSTNVFQTPKPEALIQKILNLATNEGDLIVDSFVGSATTSAVAHKMGRSYIGVELGEHAVTHCQPRMQKVIDGEQGGISKNVTWLGGGGFRFYRLGAEAFDEGGRICPDIRFPVLAAHVWFSETATPWNGSGDSPAIGIFEGVAYALLYNGILGDKRPQGGNVLTGKTLAIIRAALDKVEAGFSGQLIVYGESSRLRDSRLQSENVIFKQTPYDVKAR